MLLVLRVGRGTTSHNFQGINRAMRDKLLRELRGSMLGEFIRNIVNRMVSRMSPTTIDNIFGDYVVLLYTGQALHVNEDGLSQVLNST